MRLIQYDPHRASAAVWLDGQQRLPPLAFVDEFAQPLIEPGMPIVRQDDGQPALHLNDFLRYVRTDGVSLKTAAIYARDLIVFGRYLRQARGKSLLEATSADVGEYRILRLEGPSEYRLAGSSWRRASLAITRFYRWAADEDVQLLEKAPKTLFRRDGAHALPTVRFVDLAAYLAFRASLRDSGARSALRNAAFAELLVSTGLRSQEANSLLLMEIPYSGETRVAATRITMLRVPERITKGCKPRETPFPKRLAREYIDPYVREERAQAVERWRGAGGHRLLQDPIIACRTNDGRISLPGRRGAIRPDRLTIPERRRLLIVPSADADLQFAEPAVLWLTEDGAPCTLACWSSIFARANRAQPAANPITPHMLRHTFAVHWLTALVRLQVRGSEGEHPSSDRQMSVQYDKVSRDPLRVIQKWLGHASYITTQKYLTYVDDALEDIQNAGISIDDDLAKEAGDCL